jgi:hypothetical protein
LRASPTARSYCQGRVAYLFLRAGVSLHHGTTAEKPNEPVEGSHPFPEVVPDFFGARLPQPHPMGNDGKHRPEELRLARRNSPSCRDTVASRLRMRQIAARLARSRVASRPFEDIWSRNRLGSTNTSPLCGTRAGKSPSQVTKDSKCCDSSRPRKLSRQTNGRPLISAAANDSSTEPTPPPRRDEVCAFSV